MEKLIDPSGPWALGQNVDGGTFKWHRVQHDVINEACPYPNGILQTFCGQRFLGQACEAADDEHPVCTDCPHE